jgi:anti-sigma regulatory factor (Ser/Thr protein kinase)
MTSMNRPDPSEPKPGTARRTRWSIERVLKNDVAELVAVTAELETELTQHQVSADVVFACSLALEEIFTNIVRHAYADAESHDIRFAARLTDEHVVLQFADDGREFDPLRARPPDLTLPPEERPIGGLGIHLTRTLAERMEYRRAGGFNHLTASFNLHPKS